MELEKIKELHLNLMEEFGLLKLGWTFEFINLARVIGRCDYLNKRIEYSKMFRGSSDEDIEDTARHEIAHALVGRGHGHGPVWKAKAIEVGAAPKARGKDTPPEAKYFVQCNLCGGIWKYQRPRKYKYCCHFCHKSYSEEWALEEQLNPNYIK